MSTETLRKYPPLPLLDRVCLQDYKVPGTDLIIEKNTPVFIALLGLHRDPEYYPDPELYDPERFEEENKRLQKPYTYLPFGDGPHNCIGNVFVYVSLQLLQHEVPCITWIACI
jgi:cytochrome P450 family 6